MAHTHEWQPNGTVEIDRVSRSPCSALDDHLWTDIISVQVCVCGKTRKVKVGDKNRRRRGDDYRRAKGLRPLGRPLR